MFDSTHLSTRDYETQQFLDGVLLALDTRGPAAARDLVHGINTLAASMARDTFATQVIPVCRTHPVYARFAADPFVQRCRDKPRGYAGDAVLLDYVYHGLSDQERQTVSEEGRAFFEITAQEAAGPHAVRERRTILAKMIDEVAQRVAQPRVLSVACGHLREAGVSQAIKCGRVTELVALDQDAQSLREISRSAYGSCVKPVEASVGAILRGRIDLGRFDLIYSAGLYDYLERDVAQALTSRLFAMLKPWGRLLIGNFVDGFQERGFIEAFMDWHLVFRSREAMHGLFAAVPSADFTLRVEEDSLRCILYADATRRDL